MGTRRNLVVTCMVAATVVCAAAPARAQGLRAEATTVDIGKVVSGDTAVASFVLVNESQRDIRILRAAPS